MLKQKLNWRTPLFFCLLPIFLVMIFLGFPLPMAPPPKNKPVPERNLEKPAARCTGGLRCSLYACTAALLNHHCCRSQWFLDAP
ncbi:MAG TPA: hypothetical protein VF663_17600 [Telluria sp.]